MVEKGISLLTKTGISKMVEKGISLLTKTGIAKMAGKSAPTFS